MNPWFDFPLLWVLSCLLAWTAAGPPHSCLHSESLRARNVSELTISHIERYLQTAGERFVKMRLHTGSQGFGVQFTSYYCALAYAIREGMPFAYEGERWNYASSQCAHGVYCYFDLVELPTTRVGDAVDHQYHSVFTGRSNLVRDASTSSYPAMLMHHEMLQPPAWAHHQGPRWWEGQVALALFCLRSHVVHEARRWSNRIGFDRPDRGECIAIHIRKRDRKELARHSIEDYFLHALDIHRTHGASSIFLATDDAATRAKARRWVDNQGGFELFMGKTRQDDDPEKRSRYMENNVTKSYTTDMLLDLHFLSECNYFIGAQRSTFSWVASRLMIGKGNERECPRWIGGPTHTHGTYRGM